jgi:hypothetical protein
MWSVVLCALAIRHLWEPDRKRKASCPAGGYLLLACSPGRATMRRVPPNRRFGFCCKWSRTWATGFPLVWMALTEVPCAELPAAFGDFPVPVAPFKNALAAKSPQYDVRNPVTARGFIPFNAERRSSRKSLQRASNPCRRVPSACRMARWRQLQNPRTMPGLSGQRQERQAGRDKRRHSPAGSAFARLAHPSCLRALHPKAALEPVG